MSGSTQHCTGCGRETPDTDPHVRCASCNGLLEVRHPSPPGTGKALRELFDGRRSVREGPLASGVWRFREVVLPSASGEVVTCGEGNTPLYTSRALSEWTGAAALHLKHEGHNPTGSFKDRGMTVGMTQALRTGARVVACASTGNTAAALAAYAAWAELPALVIVPKGEIALGKLTQAVAYGARTLLVRGGFDQCLELVQRASEQLGVYLLNSVNPFRLEGQKTIVFELLQQLGWEAPDWIVVPAGNLGNTAAFGKAILEAERWGLITRRPRIAAIQAEGAAPFARSFREDFARRHTVDPRTVATAIRIGNPASHERAVQAIRETSGLVETVTDDEILEAKAAVDRAGIGCEPASAASVAGVRKLVRHGTIRSDDRVVAVLTGHLLKDPEIVARYHMQTEPAPAGANRPIEIEPDLTALEHAIGRPRA